MGTLYLVATPIGNLEDISQRALRILSQVRLIACEDTRHSKILLSHYHIETPLTSYFEHNKNTKLDFILEQLAQGDVALISDAGTPGLNDPGYELVTSALKAGYSVSPIPGPSAPIVALVASGLPGDAFLYLGYPPRKSNERRQRLSQIADLPYTMVFLEVPHRLIASMNDMLEVLDNRNIAIARELTKIHEEIFRGTLQSALEYFEQNKPRGEFTLVLEGKPAHNEIWTEEQLFVWLEEQKNIGKSTTQIAAAAAKISGWPRRKIYSLINQNQEV